ncbi:hypothetical protein HPB50_027303 [Hyalomma asiaticum]|uniref:Uncharacterized protein n=1 Tax=Hyalomma asiaticum TaxID=266040 RepID=A0ACB7S9R4_HYAAI|nr:hypothetical protein HPB50_027303 [Hyalomma asiaticum]
MRLAEFLGARHGNAVREDAELLNDIVRKSSTSFMEDMMTVRMEEMENILAKNKELSSIKTIRAPTEGVRLVKFVRYARVGRWKEAFNREQLSETLLHIEKIEHGTVIKQLWGNIWREIIRDVLQFEPGTDDVVLVNYPTSGTHWMQQIMQLIVYRGSSATTHSDFRLRSPFLEDYGKRITEVKTHSHPRILTTHFKPGKLKINQSSKYVYAARNPWDLCASRYQQCRQMPLYPLQATFEEFLPLFLKGHVPYGSYFEHVSAGYAFREEPNFFFVTYEEVAANTSGVVVRLTEFLGASHGNAVREGAELLNDIVRKSSASFMKDMMTVRMEEMENIRVTNKELSSLKNIRAPTDDVGLVKFVRYARVGRWKETFNKEQLSETLLYIEKIGHGEVVKQLWGNIWQEVMEASK